MSASPSTGRRVRFADFELDVDARVLRRAGVAVKLQQQPFDVLMTLVEHAGSLVSRQDLRERLWRTETFVDFDHSLNIAINKLRMALNDSAAQPIFIETIPRRGYRFVGLIEPPLREDEAPERLPSDSTAAPAPRHRGRPRIVAAVASLAMIAAAVGGWWLARRGADRTDGLPARHRFASIAVLPLDDLSPGASANRYFADGMTDELIASLARLDGVRVIARGSVVALTAPRRPLPQIAAALGAEALVDGTIVRAGRRVRITARLVDARAGQPVWTRSYERELEDVNDLPRDVTRDIAAEIGRVPNSDGHRAPNVPAAYDAYLRGRFAWNQRSDVAVHDAIAQFVRATELNPAYAPAYAGLADCYATLAYLSNIYPSDGFQAARAAAEHALRLDDSLAEAHASLAYTHLYYDWDWAGAEREFRRALALNPNSATAHQWYAVFLTAMMRPGEARAEIDRAKALDPLSPAIATDVGFQFYYTRQYDFAVQTLTGVIGGSPRFPLAHLWLGRAYQQQQMFSEAMTEFDAVQEALPDWPVTLAAIGSVEAWAGHRQNARRILDRLDVLSRRRYVTAYGYALVCAALGEHSAAIRWLQRGVAERTPWMVWLKMDPRWGTLADDPAFARVVSQVGLP